MTQQAGRGEPAGGGGPRAEHQEGPQRGLRPSGWMSITHTTQGDLFTPFADLNAILSKNTPTQGHPGQWGHPLEHPSWHAGLAITASVGCAHAAQKVCSGSHGRIAHNGLSCHLCHSPGHVCRPFFLKHLLRPSTHSLAFSHFNCYSFFFFPLGALVLFCLILFPCVSCQFLLSLPKRLVTDR